MGHPSPSKGPRRNSPGSLSLFRDTNLDSTTGFFVSFLVVIGRTVSCNVIDVTTRT